MEKKVAVLMAAYNGERYIDKQIKSILNQSYKNFKLIVRDDGSTDNTFGILKKYESINSNVLVFKNTTKLHGQLSNFAWLFNYAKNKNYQYIMFSDQDDIWYKNKIKLSYERITSLENKGPNLLYTNYDIYNSSSQKRKKAYDHELNYSFEQLFVQNWLMGCTMMLDRKMIELVNNIPNNVENHDYWISVVASIKKNISYLEKPTMLHRLHTNNVTARTNSDSIVNRTRKIFNIFFNSNYRMERYTVWENVFKNIKLMYNFPKKVEELDGVLHGSRFNSVRTIKKYSFKGINFMSTASFYVLIFLKGRKQDIKLSIIIPVYNVSDFVIDCLKSVFNQDLQDCEVIIIDDGSTDDTYFKVKDYSKKKQNINIKILRKKNGGQGSARNYGLRQAIGEYVWFIDSDDYISDGAVKKIKEKINNNLDLLSFNATTVNERGQNLRKINLNQIYTNSPKISEKKELILLPSITWNKIIRREIINNNNIVFPENVYFEDIYFTAITLLNTKVVWFIDDSLYYYRQRATSTTHTLSEKTLDIIKVMNSTINGFKSNKMYISYKDELEYLMIRSVLFEVVGNINKFNYKSGLQDKIISAFLKNFPNADNNKYLLKNEKNKLNFLLQRKYRLYYYKYSLFLILKDKIKRIIQRGRV